MVQNGLLPSILIKARTLAEGWHKAMIACYTEGYRTETPKHVVGDSLGYDADINVRVSHPQEEPKFHMRFLADDARGTMQYILEVTHGIHNHWKKDPNDPNDTKWGYTYNERFEKQIPFILARIRADWEKTRQKEGTGRITGRDYQFTIWRPEEDIILEQDDPPCLQRGHLRFLRDKTGKWYLNYVTDWRSRDEAKAWLSNNWAQAELQRLLCLKSSDMLGVEILPGAYIDRSSSLHLYGKYFNPGGGDDLGEILKQMIEGGFEKFSGFTLTEHLGDVVALKRLIAAQTDASDKSLGKNLPIERLVELGYDMDNFPYPAEWDSWPKSWDREPDPVLLRKS